MDALLLEVILSVFESCTAWSDEDCDVNGSSALDAVKVSCLAFATPCLALASAILPVVAAVSYLVQLIPCIIR